MRACADKLRGVEKVSRAMSEAGEAAPPKGVLRAAMLQRLREMSREDRARRSTIICERILASAAWRTAQRLLLFSPMRSEPDISLLSSAAATAGKQTFIIPRTLRAEAELQLPFVPDFVLVPGVAFSRDGYRLGRGAGFYDRLLAGRARGAFKMGVCFALQLRGAIPREGHDVLLDAVIGD